MKRYQSTVQMGFHGQDNAFGQSLGANPNHFMEPGNSKDTPTLYIENLQQQIHFMELELKILKEKIIEDEKSSGIGGLFDDEKTSHEHITQLKVKYSAMRIE